MCGICGVIGADPSVVEAMTDCLHHRGPDSVGYHRDGDVGLGNRRLSVIDPEGGDQPIYNESGDVAVVFNGLIYNFRDLRETLEAAGHRFSTDADTEVIVHGYEEYGAAFIERLNGMFAIALWDEDGQRLLLARDRVGVKPLHYAVVDGGILFGSEPKAILRSGLVEPAVDRSALRYFLQMRYSPPGTTLFEGIEKLLPGTLLDVRRTNDGWDVTRRRYWSPPDDPTPPADPVAAMRDALESAVERQMVSDVPVGFYLSGGLDTSSIVALASRYTDEPVHTFCMGFADQQWDERPDAKIVADYVGTNHHEVEIDREFMRDFPRMIWGADEPKRNLYPYYVAEAMSEEVTVALGGLGADELFGGYVYRFEALADLDRIRGAPVDDRQRIVLAADHLVDTHLEYGSITNDGVLELLSAYKHLEDPAALYVLLNSVDVIGDDAVFEGRILGEALTGLEPPERVIERHYPTTGDSLRDMAMRWDFSVKLPDDFLFVEDRMSMAHSLESRVPFLDNELVDLAFSLPLSAKFDTPDAGPTVGKAVLRKATRDLLPDHVFEKDKQGFTMPPFPFIDDELLPHGREILSDPHVVRTGLVDSSYLETLLGQGFDESLGPHYNVLWKLVALEIWYQMYIVEGASGPQPIDHYYT